MVHETFARQMATVFATSLRCSAGVTVTSIEQVAWGAFVANTPDPSYLAVLNIEPLSGPGILHFDLPLVLTAVDLSLGGSGSGNLPNRPLTEIESGLVRDLVTRVLKELPGSFEPLMAVEASVVGQESTLQFAQITAPSDLTVVVTYAVRLNDIEGQSSLCVPLSTLQPVLDAATQLATTNAHGRVGNAEAIRHIVEDRLLDAPVDVSVCFHSVQLTPAEILDLEPGDVLPLHHPVQTPLTMVTAGVPLFPALPGKRGKRLACVVVETPAEES